MVWPVASYFTYQRAVVGRAARDAKDFLRRHFGGVALASLASLLAYPGVRLVLSPTDAQQEILLLLAYGLLGPILLFGLASIIFYIQGASRIYHESRLRIAALEARLAPKVVAALPGNGGVFVLEYGHTSETLGGQRRTVLRAFSDLISLVIQNTSDDTIHGLRARLAGAWHIKDGRTVSLQIVEAVQLPFERAQSAFPEEVSVDPHEMKRLFIAHLRHNGALVLYRDYKTIPVEYHQLFGEAGQYILKIQVDAANMGPLPTLIQVVTEGDDESDKRPRTMRGRATVTLLTPDDEPQVL